MSQLICKNLLVGYEGKAILDPLNFEIHAGDYLCVVGENGAGKSNLMSAFVLLPELTRTMDVRDAYERLLTRDAIFQDEKMEKVII